MIHSALPSGTNPISRVSIKLIGTRLRSGSGIPNVDLAVAMRKSHRADSCIPPASAYPSTAPMTGLRIEPIFSNPFLAACLVPTPPAWSRSVISRRSAPAQKARPPPPVRTTTRTSSSLSASSKLSYRPFITPVLRAFILASLWMVIHATRLRFS